MSALGRVVRAGVGRRRVRTVVTVLTTLMAVTASVLAVGLLVAARAPFERAFAEQRGAHLTGRFDGTKVTAARLAATADAPGVTAAAGPFPIVSVRPRTVTGSDFLPAGVDLPPMTVVGRAESGGPVDVIDLVEGEWVTRPGQIVVAADAGPFRPGDRLAFPGTPGGPTLTVVGLARSVTGTGEAWVTPAQAEALAGAAHDTGGAGGVGAVGGTAESGNPSRVGGGAESGNSTGPGGGSAAYEMLYRFRQAVTEADLAAARAAIVADVPEGAMSGARSYLTVRQDETANAMAFVPFLAAFGVLGLCLSVLVIGIVVGGAVGAATRRIGVLKALGFTPAQVVRAYVAQALVPAALGCVLGVVLGNALALPVLNEVGEAFGAPAGGLPVWVDVAVPGAALLLVAAAAVVPALRAGRLRTVEAIAVGGGAGRAGGAGHGGPGRRRAARAGRAGSELRRVARLFGARRLSLLPPAVRLGLAQPFARPARSATVAAAVVFGALSVTFAVGLALTLGKVQEGRMLDSAGSVVVEAGGGQGPPGAQVVPAEGTGGPGGEREKADPAAVATVLRAQGGTRRFYGTAQTQVAVSGVTGATTVVAYEGDSAWGAPDMVSGHWLDGPGQAVVTARFLTAAGIGVGDTVTLGERGRRTTVRIVGEAFFTQDGGMTLLTSTATLTELGLGEEALPGRFHVRTASGTDQAQYLDALNRALDGAGLAAFAHAGGGNSSSVIVAMDALIGTLTLMLVVVAGLGVLHTVVLDTRERVRDLGVLKALGMTPRQTVAMVVVSVAGVGLPAGLVAVPAGIVLHGFVTPFMGDAVGMTLPDTVLAVYDGPVLACLALGGLVIAVAGALLPAGWAAGTGTARALRTE
ncbi:FtsX-like permease family protein [Streptomyces sp. ID01-12c]|uniref:ABC transporter permease n=1 Tax=Streptomyces caniscabiei TaxID=2746961 RepID=UPI00178762D5|nr:ABC transporter permease [Streptomyces caniscabiei]MBD9703000.1 FtsX-like permease family protein [Streptomyces caniscabiei]MDX3732154.1 FtsX-like permease family protein [Streptomyces caniscabiei]